MPGGVLTVGRTQGETMAGKDEKTKREPGKLGRFYHETVGELKKVSWPTWPEARNLTVIVLIVMTAMALFLWLMDSGATSLLAAIMGVK
jgi:preprotein translocase subunit SecE